MLKYHLYLNKEDRKSPFLSWGQNKLIACKMNLFALYSAYIWKAMLLNKAVHVTYWLHSLKMFQETLVLNDPHRQNDSLDFEGLSFL